MNESLRYSILAIIIYSLYSAVTGMGPRVETARIRVNTSWCLGTELLKVLVVYIDCQS